MFFLFLPFIHSNLGFIWDLLVWKPFVTLMNLWISSMSMLVSFMYHKTWKTSKKKKATSPYIVAHELTVYFALKTGSIITLSVMIFAPWRFYIYKTLLKSSVWAGTCGRVQQDKHFCAYSVGCLKMAVLKCQRAFNLKLTQKMFIFIYSIMQQP